MLADQKAEDLGRDGKRCRGGLKVDGGQNIKKTRPR